MSRPTTVETTAYPTLFSPLTKTLVSTDTAIAWITRPFHNIAVNAEFLHKKDIFSDDNTNMNNVSNK